MLLNQEIKVSPATENMLNLLKQNNMLEQYLVSLLENRQISEVIVPKLDYLIQLNYAMYCWDANNTRLIMNRIKELEDNTKIDVRLQKDDLNRLFENLLQTLEGRTLLANMVTTDEIGAFKELTKVHKDKLQVGLSDETSAEIDKYLEEDTNFAVEEVAVSLEGDSLSDEFDFGF